MTAKEETQGINPMNGCSSFMAQFFGAGSEEGKIGKFDMKGCEEMMKQFCAGKEGKMDMAACRAQMAQFFAEMNKKACCGGGQT